ncbi:MAG: transcription antitermination factor NusB [Propionicimonas sp.]|uniref:transcription antitermination factor NusB n=1 Tax=Propionicimonas sp. TaxID=1955623 RepID=UPI002B1F8420|nr:transcription antitermination factor NusB [Propionicimonas sp.]MEA4943119.1 transcription antitermination factor NusB [Propionicimonas sp.]MEA5117862.1 transcription antitermination factor NusB [Propionicimonas sp.]
MPTPTAKRGSARTKARKRALDILFEADLRGVDPLTVLADQVALADPPVRPFSSELVEGVSTNRVAIDQLIAGALADGWTLERMPRVDRNLARIAVYEIVHTEVSDQVAVAECVALAQELSTDDSATFLNGMLRTVAAGRG